MGENGATGYAGKGAGKGVGKGVGEGVANMEKTATLKYNFDYDCWVAVADWDDRISGSGEDPSKAIQCLRGECNKYDLWPKD